MAKKNPTITGVMPKLTALAESLSLEFVGAEFVKRSEGIYLNILIDKEGGLNLDDCERFHRACVPLVEHIDYDFLECSSPGIDRPLSTERDFAKNIGKPVEVRLFTKQDGKKAFIGTLLSFENGKLTIEENGKKYEFLQSATALVRPYIDYEAELLKGEDE